MNLRLKAVGIVSSMFAGIFLFTEFARVYLTVEMVEWAMIVGLVYGCYRAVLMVLEMNEYNNRPKDTFPDEKL